ncbi:NAD(P)/FAD-dependent oxidoreductase [Roseinatronobacter sp. NSM]|uniref:NAD(P)/FAD-dependent oxidoreductase n=1 Tax=Roseinatronobacter sp. NSM TaxID=3457785 RepID=UPI00403517E3
MTGLVIVGAGECGTRAAFSARDAGYSGPITLIGQETGLPYERPPLSKPDAGAVKRHKICAGADLRAANITYRDGISATRIDVAAQSLALSDGTAIGYARLLLATGGTPRRLRCAGAEQALVLRSYDDANAIFSQPLANRHVVIVGAGLIGLELAASLRRLGARVTVLEAGARALGRAVPEPLASRLVARHCAAGVSFRFNCTLDAISKGQVQLNGGDVLPCDMVIAAIGVVPETALAQGAGLECENGICVDGQLRCSGGAIFAAGDCAALRQPDGSVHRFETWRNARDQGILAGRALAGDAACFEALPWFWSDQYDLGLQVVGNVAGAPAASRKLVQDGEILFWLGADGALIGAAGLGAGRSSAKDIALAERLIQAAMPVTPDALSDVGQPLKALLRRATAA